MRRELGNNHEPTDESPHDKHLKASPNARIHTDPGAPTFPFDTDRYQPGSSLADPHARGSV